MSIGSINGLMYYKARYYSTALGRFLQVDPIGYEDQMNLYAYVHNDPLNFTDPMGLAKCGDNLEGADCDTALDDAQAARTEAQNAAGVISGIAGKVENGEDLTSEEQAVVDLIKSNFGDDFGSAENLGKVADGLNQIADKIGARGEGATLKRSPGGRGRAFVRVGENSIYLGNSYFSDSNDLSRQRTMAHEGAHLAGKRGDVYRGTDLRYLVRQRNRNPSGYTLLYNADSYACSISAYVGVC